MGMETWTSCSRVPSPVHPREPGRCDLRGAGVPRRVEFDSPLLRDGDGDLDSLQAGFATLPEDADPSAWVPPGMPIRLALNDGNGRFVEATERLPGHRNDGYPFVASFIDMDGDLDPDLFVANDFAQIGTTK